jgi:hypothetical protein
MSGGFQMFRGQARASVLAVLVVVALGGVANAESYTTRIEPRPFYGAVVTLEEGVRVIRPLPPVRQVIINPNGTPLSLGFNDTRVYEQSTVTYQGGGAVVEGGGGDAIYSAPLGGFGRGIHRGRGHAGDHFSNHHGAGHGIGGISGH